MTTFDVDLDPLAAVDLLAIGAHPDDVELGMGGTLVLHHRLGHRIGVVDLTRGELGSKGSPELRAEEARAAATVYGAQWRVGLDLGDNRVVDAPEPARTLARVVRMARPSLVLTHHAEDRHPDHRAAHGLVRRAVFAAGLVNLELGLPHHVISALAFFLSDEVAACDLVVDVTPVWTQRLATLRCFASQFTTPTVDLDHRYYGIEDQLAAVDARARVIGQQIGVRYGEGFVLQRPVPTGDLLALLASATPGPGEIPE